MAQAPAHGRISTITQAQAQAMSAGGSGSGSGSDKVEGSGGQAQAPTRHVQASGVEQRGNVEAAVVERVHGRKGGEGGKESQWKVDRKKNEEMR